MHDPVAQSNAMAPKPRKNVLVTIGWPRDGATGPVQSLFGLAQTLADEFDFQVIARDERLGGPPNGEVGWRRVGPLDRHWCTMKRFRAENFLSLVKSVPHDVHIMNGFFDHEFTIPTLIFRRLGLLPRKPAILSPRGEFSAGPAAMARPHKKIYLKLARVFGLLDDVVLHATVDSEADDIRRYCPWVRNIVVAPNIRALDTDWAPPTVESAANRPLRVVFLSRIDRKKNVDYALKVIRDAGIPIEFDLYGPVNDEPYWDDCLALIKSIPPHVSVNYRGAIPNADVSKTLARYDLFFLPTAGENFGHAIFDALSVGVPVLLSDQTPWLDLKNRKAGWSLPLSDPAPFSAALVAMRNMDVELRRDLVRGARATAEHAVTADQAVARSRDMLHAVLRGSAVTTSTGKDRP